MLITKSNYRVKFKHRKGYIKFKQGTTIPCFVYKEAVGLALL